MRQISGKEKFILLKIRQKEKWKELLSMCSECTCKVLFPIFFVRDSGTGPSYFQIFPFL